MTDEKADKTMENPLLISVKKAADILGIGRTLFYSMDSTGQLGPMPVKLGRRTLWRIDELKAWVSAGCPSRDKWVAISNK